MIEKRLVRIKVADLIPYERNPRNHGRESSANINTNPRSENTVVTVDTELVDDYIRLFGQIKPFNKDPGAPPFEV